MPNWKLPLPQSIQKHATALVFAALAVCLALGVMLFIHPPCQQIPYRDSGVFLYTGSVILDGGVPYRDVWDHKPPVIFFINALGLAVAGGSPAGVYWIEGLLLAGAFWLAARLLLPRFGRLASAGSLVLTAYTMLFLNQAGNLTTGYTIPMQFLAFWLALRLAQPRPGAAWRAAFFTGLLVGLLFFTKQNTVSIGAAIVIYLLIVRLGQRSFKKWLLEMLAMLVGFASQAAAFVIYFALNNALADFWDAAFVYNFYWVAETEGLQGWLLAALDNLKVLGQSGLLHLGVIGWVIGLGGLFLPAVRRMPFWPLLALALIDLPLEVLLANLSDNSYAHYFLAVLPVLAVLAAFSLWLLGGRLRRLGFAAPALPKGDWLRAAALGLVVLGLAALNLGALARLRYCSGGKEIALLSKYIDQVSAPGEPVLFWGAETALNFATGHPSPTRYAYQYPLYTQGYTSEEKILEFLDDLEQNPPRLIIDTHRERTPIYQFPLTSPQIEQRVQALQARYRRAVVINGWDVYLDPMIR